MTRNRVLSRFVVVASIAWFVLWACAPMSSNPPPTPMPEAAKRELTVGTTGGHHDSVLPTYLQASARIATGSDKHHEAGFLVNAPLEMIGYIGAGGYYRHSLVHDDTISAGLQVELGWAWGGASLPLAYRVTDSFWLTTMPGVGIGFSNLVRLPVGIGWQYNEHARLDAEMGIGNDLQRNGSYAYGAIGLAFAK